MNPDASPGIEGPTFVAPRDGESGFGGRPVGPDSVASDAVKDAWGTFNPAPPPAFPSNPSEAGPVPVKEKTDPFSDKSPEERGGMAVATAKNKIKEKLDTGGYDDEKKRRAETALSYDETKPASETSASLKSLLDIVRETRGPNPTPGEYYSDLYDELSRNAVVIIGNDVLSLGEFEKARQDAVTAGDQARVDELDKGIYGFRFEPEVKPRDPADQALGQNISALQRQVDERKDRGESTETHEDILRALRIADGFKGKARAFVVKVALNRLIASGLSEDPAGLEGVISGSADSVSQSEADILKQAELVGYTSEQAVLILDSLRKGNFAYLQSVGYFKNPGAKLLFYGEELTDEEMAKHLGLVLPGEEGRKFGKDQALMILLLALVGVSSPTIKAAMGELRR